MKNILVLAAFSFLAFSCTKGADSSQQQAEPAKAESTPVLPEPIKSEHIPKQHVLILQYQTAQQLGNDVKAVFSLFDKNVFLTSKFESYYDEVYKLVEKIDSGELVKGDKVVLLLNVHGGKKQRENQFGHVFSAEDGDFNITRLSGMINSMLKQGVQVAISDQSCYAGESLKFYKNEPALKNLCVMTADSNEQVSFAGGLDNFLNFIKVTKSFNLETAYVNGRESNYNAAPGINSDIFEDFHIRTSSLQKQFGIDLGAGHIWLYLNNYRSLDGKAFQIDLLKKDILEPLKAQFSDTQINFEDEFKSLDFSLDRFSEALNKLYYNDIEMFSFLNKTIELDNGFKATYLDKLVYDTSGQQGSDVRIWTKYNIDLSNSKSPSISKEEYDKIENRFRSFNKVSYTSDPEFEKLKEKFKSLSYGDLMFKIGLSVAESDMHRKFYNEQLKNGKSQPNPCREFILNQD